MNLKLSVIGLGKLGSTMSACFIHKGFKVIGVDKNTEFVKMVNKGKSPIYEPHVNDLIHANKKNIQAVTDISFAVLNTEVSFIIVPTPSMANGLFSTDYVEAVVSDIAEALKEKDSYHLIVITSTVLPGDTARMSAIIEKISGKKLNEDFGLVYNPDFIAIGKIVHDFLNPDMLLIGESDEKAGDLIEHIHRNLVDNTPTVHRMNWHNAELSKISLNSYCTMKITFANIIAEICEAMPGGDAKKVLKAVGSDSRVGNKYFKGGLGYSGPCLRPEGLVQTDKGLREIKEIKKGDRVITHKGRYRKVTKVYKRPYTGVMSSIISMGFPYSPMVLTPDHPVWGSKRVQRTKNKYRVVSTTGQKRLGPASGLGDIEFIPAFKMDHGDLVALPLLKEKNIRIPVIEFKRQRHYKIPEKVKITPDLMRFFGFFVSEGCTWHGEVKITLHKKEVRYAEDIVGIVKKHFKATAAIKPQTENCIKVRFTSTLLTPYLVTTFGHRAENKCVPMDWLFLPEKHLIELLRGIWYGDGSRSTNRFIYGTVSPSLHRFLQLCFLRLGISFASKTQEEKIDKKGVKHQKAYFLNVSNGLYYKKMNDLFPELKIEKIPKGSKQIWVEQDKMLSTVRSVGEEFYKGYVHNLEVEDDNSYMLESGVVHNCFPRDNRALSKTAQRLGVTETFCDLTDSINNYHKTDRICNVLIEILKEKKISEIAVLGLSYKEDTTLIEESVSIEVIKTLTKYGIDVIAYDPAAMPLAKKEFSGNSAVILESSVLSCIRNQSVCFIATPWKEFSDLKIEQIINVMDNPVILDAWGVLSFPDNCGLDIRRLGRNNKGS